MSRPRQSVASTTSVSTTGASYVKPLLIRRTIQEKQDFKKEIETEDHIISLKELEFKLDTNAVTGLSKVKADHLLQLNGPNILVESAGRSTWLLICKFLFGGFNLLLWIGALLCIINYCVGHYVLGEENFDELYLGCILVVVNTVTGVFGFYQEYSNVCIMDSFKKMVPTFATVIRDGQEYVIPTEEVVVGDLVQLQAGGTVPADIRITESSSLQVDNSPITGESQPQTKTPKCTSDNPLETQNLVFFSTNIIQGRGIGLVIACGDDTLIGHIAGLTTTVEKVETPIHKEIKYFVKVVTWLAVVTGLVFFILCLLIGYSFFTSFSFFIALVVANVPEGLPVTLTACMTLTAKRMASKNCLVKKLECIETLGACSVICSDKTGTLTQNRMTVSHMYVDRTEYDVLESFSTLDSSSAAFKAMTEVGILCSRATFVNPPEEEQEIPIYDRKVTGDASESAILKFVEQLIGETAKRREQCRKVCEIPFNSNNKFQVSIHTVENNQFLLVMKGAPERLVDRCSTYLVNGEEIPIDEKQTEEIIEAIMALGQKGERVLGFADLLLPEDNYPEDFEFNSEYPNFPLEGLRFLGLLSMMDPPRQGVLEAVNVCRSAGIRIIMVTGDHPVTAEAIARKVGIISATSEMHHNVLLRANPSFLRSIQWPDVKTKACVVTGAELKDMTEMELYSVLSKYKEIVFARTSPQQKLKIVEALQNDFVVAVTGDGVNDSPALKKADIGIAMGIAGSDVAKNAADMILLDDNFSTIVHGIEEGRLIFDNLKKSIAYLFTSDVPEFIPFILMVTINIPQPLSVMAIVLIDVGTDLWPAISLAYERPEADIMHKNPRQLNVDRLINMRLVYYAYFQIGFLQSLGAFTVYFYIMAQHGFFIDRLIGIRVEWDSKKVNALLDSYGQEWSYEERQILQRKCFTGFFVSIVITQLADILICKTRRLSLFQQGMHNTVMNLGIVFALVLMFVAVYCPGFDTFFFLEAIDASAYILTLPFAVIMVTYEEIRKYFIRKYPNGFIYRETYY